MNTAAIIARIKQLEARNPSELMINAIDSQGREVVASAREVFDASGRLINGFVGVSMRIVASGNDIRLLERVLKNTELRAQEVKDVEQE